ncbi:hypothetical protein MP638_006818 [Amoeboaphelidium occidentale]|nr:hypothetical protein MP638_006818 [Amoeboaphelidium occidentale]
MIKSHWEVKEIWDWPMSEKNKLQALGKRGKGPIARAEGKSAKAAGKKKRK